MKNQAAVCDDFNHRTRRYLLNSQAIQKDIAVLLFCMLHLKSDMSKRKTLIVSAFVYFQNNLIHHLGNALA